MPTETTLTVKREELNPCTIKLDVECPPELIKKATDKAYKQYAKKIKVPGFRPGTAPRNVIEQMIPRDEVAGAAAEETIRAAFKIALKQEELEPVTSPRVNVNKFDLDELKCEFEIIVPLPPVVELGDYNTLTAQRPITEVTDEDVNYHLEDLRKRHGEREQVTDRGIRQGDMAVVNLKIDDEEGDGRSFVVTVGQTFPDLDAALEGMKTDEIKSLELNFPDAFGEADLAGQKKKVQLTVRSITGVTLPDLDDDLVAKLDVEDLGTVEDLKNRLRENIGAAKEQRAKEMIREQLLDDLLQKSSVQVADTTWQSVVERRIADLEKELKDQGQSLDDYAASHGMDKEKFMEAQERDAQMHVKRAVLVEKIFKDQEMKITDEMARDHFLQIAHENRVPAEDLQKFSKQYGGAIRDEVIYRAMYQLVMEYLESKAQIQDAPTG